MGLGLSDKRADPDPVDLSPERQIQPAPVNLSTSLGLTPPPHQLDMASYLSASEALAQEKQSSNAANSIPQGRWADKYRGVGHAPHFARVECEIKSQGTALSNSIPPA